MKSLSELRWDCESRMSSICYLSEKEDPDHKCKCELPDNWTEEECLKYLKEME